MARIARLISRGEDANALLEESFRLFPDNLHLLWLQARARMREGRYEAAVGCLHRLIERGQAGDFSTWVAYDPRLFGLFAYASLGECSVGLGRHGESSKWFARAAG